MIGECFVGSVGTAEIGNLKRKFWCGRLMGKLLGLLVQMVSQSTWRLYRHTSNTTLGVLWLYFKNRVHVLEPPQVACQMFRNSARRKKLWCLNQIRFSLYAPSMGCLLASFSSIQDEHRGSRCDICDDEIGKRLMQQNYSLGSDTCKQAACSIGQTIHFTGTTALPGHWRTSFFEDRFRDWLIDWIKSKKFAHSYRNPASTMTYQRPHWSTTILTLRPAESHVQTNVSHRSGDPHVSDTWVTCQC